MKIDGGFSLSKTRTKSKTKHTSRSSPLPSVDFLSHSDETTETPSTAASASTQKIDVILAIQEIDNNMERNKKSTYRSNQLLEGLEHLKAELLSGTLTPEKLNKLKEILETPMPYLTDKKLVSIQKQIEQRVRIELAKYDVA